MRRNTSTGAAFQRFSFCELLQDWRFTCLGCRILPCPLCGGLVQRIVYAENECNDCPNCQTGGKLLADRALSRLLKPSWPKKADEP